MAGKQPKKPLTDRQKQLLATRRERTLARLEQLVAEARATDFTVGERVTQPIEVQRLQRRVRGVTLRWAPLWTTAAARNAHEVHIDHVVPVIVLAERLLLGASLESVLAQALLCRVTREEHRAGAGLEVAFRLRQADLYQQMLQCPIEQLSSWGWERYRRGGLTVSQVKSEH